MTARQKLVTEARVITSNDHVQKLYEKVEEEKKKKDDVVKRKAKKREWQESKMLERGRLRGRSKGRLKKRKRQESELKKGEKQEQQLQLITMNQLCAISVVQQIQVRRLVPTHFGYSVTPVPAQSVWRNKIMIEVT